MTLAEKLIQVLGPLVEGRVYFDETPKDGPEAVPYIVILMGPGKRQFYVEQEVQDIKDHRVGVVGATKFPADREILANQIELAICKGGFPASEPKGGWISGSSVTHGELYSQQQFGINY